MESIVADLPAQAKDIKLNLPRVLTDEESGWTQAQLHAIAYALLLARPNSPHHAVLFKTLGDSVNEDVRSAAKIAVNTMAMNNVYYRFLHLSDSPELKTMPAGLRMQMLRQHGIDASLFEAMSLAISILSGCGMCIQAHVAALKKQGCDAAAILAVARLTAVVQAYLSHV